MELEKFLEGLKKLSDETRVVIIGKASLRPADDYTAFAYQSADVVELYGGIKDRSGLFLISEADKKPEHKEPQKYGTAPQISSDYGAYDCPITGQMVEGRAAHRENLKKHGCRLLEKGERQETEKRREEIISRDAARFAESVVLEAASKCN